MSIELPQWAAEMRDLFRSGSVAQFILHGNVFDVVPATGPGGGRLLSLNTFLDEIMFENIGRLLIESVCFLKAPLISMKFGECC